MKKTAVIILTLLALVCVTAILPSADEVPDEVSSSAVTERALEGYILSSDDKGVMLSEYIEGVPTPLAHGEVAELISLVRDNSRVLFDRLILTETLEVPEGGYVFSGAVTFCGNSSIIVNGGTSIAFSSLSLSFERGALRIRGGSVTVTDSHVTSMGCAAVLDYDSSSSLRLNSGSIIGAGSLGTVDVRSGSLVLLGGSVVSSDGTAVRNDSLTYLSGAPIVTGVGCDLLTDKPIRLSYGGVPYSSLEPLTVRYGESLVRGCSYEIFYTDNSTSYSNVTLLDASGREYGLTQLPGVGAVHLPYAVRYYNSDGLIATDECLSGEYSTPPTLPDRVGYSFSGWYLDREGRAGYSTETAVTSDLTVYAIYTLLPPEFTARSIDTVYDGRDRTLKLGTLTHALDGVYSYVWYKGETPVSTSPYVTVRDVSDSGSYACDITFSYGGAAVTVRAEGITVSIAKRMVEIPEVAPVYYNGRTQYPDISDTSLYTVGAVEGCDAGVYGVPLTLTDTDNYRWETGDSSVTEATFEILKAKNAWVEELSVYDIYFGAELNFNASPKFGTATVLFALTENGPYLETPPLTVGEYYAIARVVGSDNYSSLESVPCRFMILEDRVVSVSISAMPDKTEYRAFEHFNPYGLVITAKYAGGRSENVTPERISVTYQRAEAFRFGDSGVTLSFGGASVTLPLTVTRAVYDLSSLVLGATTVIYDAGFHTLEYTLPAVIGLDGIPLTVTATGGGVDVGEYAVRLVFDSESLDYDIPDSITEKLTILPVSREILWQNTEFVYDGTLKTPTAAYIDVYGVMRFLPVAGGEVNAGVGYLATAVSDTVNYTFSGLFYSYDIRRADYDMSGVYWSSDSFVYDADEHSVTLLGLPDGVRVVGYTDATAICAGEYSATAALLYDTVNYNPPDAPTHKWRILRADYDLSELRFDSASYVYDGTPHYPAVSGNIPIGLDGSNLSYSFSAGVTHVSEGRVTVRITFTSDSCNYNIPESLTAYVEITPMPITVVWSGQEFTYDGTLKLPTAVAGECEISVYGGERDAGEYIATARTLDSDYYVTNSSCSFVILPTENRFIHGIEISDVFYGTSPVPSAEAVWGEIVYNYYLDRECTRAIAGPTEVGTYYVRASVPASRNYLLLVGECAEFEIIEIRPVSITASLISANPSAYSVLSYNDFSCVIHNNDGSESTPDPSLLHIIYENGDSLRRSDTHVTLEYRGITFILELEVDYATYDTSRVAWEGTSVTYDGTPKCPTLVGLPVGVGVISYVIDGGVAAGEYPVSAILSYDSENYLEPAIPECILTVNKCVVELPTVDSVVYDGTSHAPVPSLPCFTLSEVRYADAGRYSITASLRDPANYMLSDGGDSGTVVFEILPREISVTVSNGEKYLWEDVRYGGYVADLSAVIAGDDPMLREYVSADSILAVCDNPNYRANVIPGRLNSYSYPSPERCADIFVVLFIVLTVLLVSLIVWFERARISDFIAVTCCRISHRRASRSAEYHTAHCDTVLPHDVASMPYDSASPNQGDTELIADPDTEINDPDGDPETDESSDLSESTPDSDEPKSDSVETVDRHNDAFAELESTVTAIDTERADELISDSLAKGLVKRGREIVRTSGSERSIINVDTLSRSFSSGDRVDVNILKQKSLIPYDTAYIKVLARGVLDKSLSVYANDFSLAAVKMIALTGGEAVRVVTVKEKKDTNN